MTSDRFVLHQRGVAEVQRNGDVRPDHEPVHTVRAGGQHHGLLITAVREGASVREPDLQPSATATTGHGCGLAVISHFTGRGTHAGGVAQPQRPRRAHRDSVASAGARGRTSTSSSRGGGVVVSYSLTQRWNAGPAKECQAQRHRATHATPGRHT